MRSNVHFVAFRKGERFFTIRKSFRILALFFRTAVVLLVILFFVGSYAVLQWIFYHRVCAAFSPRWPWRVALVAWLVLTLFAPLWSRMFDRAGWGRSAWWCAGIGYTWLAVVFWFGCLTLLLWAWNASAAVLQSRLGLRFFARCSARRGTLVSFAIVLLAVVWGVIEANQIAVKHVLIQSPRIPPSTKPVRLVHISDLHIGKPRGARFARRVAAMIRELHPDVLVSTGDLIDAATLCQEGIPAIFRELEVPLGKYAVLGNHDYYTGLAPAMAFHDAAGFVVLRGRSMSVTPWLALVGVDDPAAKYTGQGGVVDEQIALQDTRPHQMVILLKHQPTVTEAALLHVDLQLSGHTHGGQLFPYGLFVRLFYRYRAGMHRINSRMLLYVSRGAGVWGTPMRLFARPEISVFVLAPASP